MTIWRTMYDHGWWEMSRWSHIQSSHNKQPFYVPDKRTREKPNTQHKEINEKADMGLALQTPVVCRLLWSVYPTHLPNSQITSSQNVVAYFPEFFTRHFLLEALKRPEPGTIHSSFEFQRKTSTAPYNSPDPFISFLNVGAPMGSMEESA